MIGRDHFATAGAFDEFPSAVGLEPVVMTAQRIEFCEADVLDAFDEWRRAVGVTVLSVDPDSGSTVEEPVPGPYSRSRRSLRSQIEAVLARLAVLRGSDPGGVPADALAEAVGAIEPLLQQSEHARGEQRQKVVGALLTADARLIAAIEAALPPQIRADYDAEAARELEPFRPRMTEGAISSARRLTRASVLSRL